jgi:3-oxoacyl-[acyl-carrier-protein] synthase-3
MAATIAGLGAAVPEARVTNADLEARVDTSDSWILERTGIRERRAAGPGETTATLATAAGAAAIKDAGLTPGDIDLVIVATCTPEQPLPATAAFVQEGLGLQCGAFDLNAACSGFVYGLVMASGLMNQGGQLGGGLEAVLVIGAETLTRIVNPDDRTTCILFGDGAGAAVMRPGAAGSDAGLLAWDLGCDGSGIPLLQVLGGGSRQPLTRHGLDAGDQFVTMDGSSVFRFAVRAVVDSSERTLERAGVTPQQIDWFVPHQANQRIIDAAVRRLGIAPDRVVSNLDRYGNTSAASIPLALEEVAPMLSDGDLVLLSGFGAGLTWASALLRWGRPA